MRATVEGLCAYTVEATGPSVRVAASKRVKRASFEVIFMAVLLG
jgi:hypothetical protein